MGSSPANAASLWHEFHGELHGFLKRRVDSEPLADDILQQAFLKAHTEFAKGTHLTQPRAWLYQVVRNLAKDAARSQGSQRALAVAVAHEPAPHPSPPVAPDAALEPETFAIVARILPLFVDQLPAPYRDALRLVELEGLTHAEAAARAGVSVTCMKTRVRRGRQKVWEALQDCCAFELDARGRMTSCQPRSTICCENKARLEP